MCFMLASIAVCASNVAGSAKLSLARAAQKFERRALGEAGAILARTIGMLLFTLALDDVPLAFASSQMIYALVWLGWIAWPFLWQKDSTWKPAGTKEGLVSKHHQTLFWEFAGMVMLKLGLTEAVVEESSGFPSALFLGGVIIGSAGFLLGCVCAGAYAQAQPYTADMDPTDEELANINTVQDALDWAGVAGVLQQELIDTLGGVQRVREVPLIHRQAWDTAVNRLRVPEEVDPHMPGPPNVRPLNPVEGACRIFQKSLPPPHWPPA
eukprot:s625_g8.t1